METAKIITDLISSGAKIDVEGDQLKIHAGKDKMTPELIAFIRENKQSVIDHVKDLQNDIRPAPLRDHYPASPAQKRLYFLHDLHKESLVYNLPQVVKIEGVVDKEKLVGAFRKLIARHEILRTTFALKGEEPAQVILEDFTFDIELYPPAGGGIESILEKFVRSFDLRVVPLMRAGLVDLDPGNHVLLIDMHHIITDGVTHQLLMKELVDIYNGIELPTVKLHYKDYSEWLNAERQLARKGRQRQFWLSKFADMPEPMLLPFDFPRPVTKTHEGKTVRMIVDGRRTQALRAISKRCGATLFMTVFAIYNVLLSRFTGQKDLTIGSPVAGRSHADLENVLGMFVNIVPLRNQPGDDLSFSEFLRNVRDNTLLCIENQDYQYEDLIHDLRLERSPSSYPLIDIMFIHRSADESSVDIPGLSFKTYNFDMNMSKFDLMLVSIEENESLHFEFQYSTELYKEGTIRRLMAGFERLIDIVTEDEECKISKMEVADPEEYKKWLNAFNNTYYPYPLGGTVVDLFEEKAIEHPEAIAVRTPDGSLSYARLSRRVDNMAAYLQQAHRVQKGDLVGIMLDHEEWLLPTILGILKAGGCYVPMDVNTPADRVQSISEDSGFTLLITRSGMNFPSSAQIRPVFLDKVWETIEDLAIKPDKIHFGEKDLAYVMYTSGSTGKPKGVMIEHRSLVNYSCWAARTYVKRTGISFPLFTSLSFDLTVTSIFVPLISGNTIEVYPGNGKELQLEQVLRDNRCEIVKLTPSHLKLLKDSACFEKAGYRSKIRQFIVGGEELTTQLCNEVSRLFGGDIEIYNEYGPTEATVGCMIHVFDSKTDNGRSVPIGRPIDNARIYLLDRDLNPVPMGVTGELYVAGDGIAAGYLNNAELSAERFLENPGMGGERIYKTGDLARRLPEGILEFLGRGDNQVKVNGYRIELGEIESQLARYETIDDCVVVVREKGDVKHIVAYYVSDNSIDEPVLKGFLSQALPHYMIPVYWVRVDKIPLTANGKTDIRALPEPEAREAGSGSSPSNELQVKLSEIWADILKVERQTIDLRSNFFTLGGHSLRTYNLLHRVEREFDVKIPVPVFFENPTIEEMEKHILIAQVARIRSGQQNKVSFV